MPKFKNRFSKNIRFVQNWNFICKEFDLVVANSAKKFDLLIVKKKNQIWKYEQKKEIIVSKKKYLIHFVNTLLVYKALTPS